MARKPSFEVVEAGRAYAFDADGGLLRLASEAYRIRLAHLLLADDPGAGKTITAGLLIKELLIRGDLERCLIVAPGGLVEQWQEEMAEKFSLGFDILSRDQI